MTDSALPPRTPPEPRPASSAATRAGRSGWYWLLLVPLVLVLYPPLYNRTDPVLFGIPFFYWYQLAVIPVSMLCTVVAHLATRPRRAPDATTGPEVDR